MKFDNVTLKDIAKALNLSTSTVSRALRDSYEVSPETKKKVLAYAEKINYRPNPIALSLKEKRTRSVGVIVSEFANNFFAQAINGIESIAYNRGYHVIVTQSHESQERELDNIMHLASRGVDGLLVSLSSKTIDVSPFKDLQSRGLPIVFFDRITEDIDTHKVVCNNYQGAYKATEHLIAQGYKNIAHISSSPSLSISSQRMEGYKDALQAYNIPFNQSLISYCSHGGLKAEEVKDAVYGFFKGKIKPDALFTAADRITTLSYGLLKKMQFKSQPGFAGFTNTNLAELFYPSLTTVRQPAFEMGQSAIEYLLQLIESKKPVKEFKTTILETELIVRESSKSTN